MKNENEGTQAREADDIGLDSGPFTGEAPRCGNSAAQATTEFSTRCGGPVELPARKGE